MVAKQGLRLLHTSDWHLGNTIGDKDRSHEFKAFLDWMRVQIVENAVDVLIIAGDVFDVSSPGSKIQGLYYRFLASLQGTCCHDVVVVAGNHDSPSLLDAPKEVLSALQVHVVGAIDRENLGKEVFVIRDETETPLGIICAVPYLREGDLRFAAPGETDRDVQKLVVEGTRAHYRRVVDLALEERARLNAPLIPIIATGHLFAAGVSHGDDDGMRAVVGNLGLIEASAFPEELAYVALGHIHRAQCVSKRDDIRYSGSPFLMGFDEIGQKRLVHLVDFEPNKACSVKDIEMPSWQDFVRIQGDLTTIRTRLQELKLAGSTAFVEIIYNGAEKVGNLNSQLMSDLQEASFVVVRTRNNGAIQEGVLLDEYVQDLSEFTEEEILKRVFDKNNVGEAQRTVLLEAFREIVRAVNETDEG